MPSLALACRLSAVSRASRRPFSPASLFSSGEQGVWYDPSDFSTLFQDAAGTIPVTAVEQPVGRILDKSGLGNHAMQTTTTSRPVLSARYNLLGYTQEFDNAGWTKSNSFVQTNRIRNNTMQGAVAGTPGTDPTTWAVAGTAGITRQLVGIGIEGGVTYIEYRFSGTATGPNDTQFDASNVIAATSGQAWSSSAFVKLQAGSLTNVTVTQIVAENNSSGNFLVASTQNIVPTSAGLQTQRFALTRTLNNASTAFVTTALRVSAAGAIDITLRIGMPQLVQGATAGDVVATYGTAKAVMYQAPDGTMSADKLVEDKATSGHVVLEGYSFSSATYTYSIYAKSGERTKTRLIAATGSGGVFVNADLSAGTVDAGAAFGTGFSVISSSILSLGNGWYRIALRFSATAVSGSVQSALLDASGNNSYTGDGTSGIYIWGADLRVADDGIGLPAYQRVNTATDFAVDGFPAAEVFDGTDDHEITAAGGGSTTAFFWCSSIRVGKVNAVQTLFSDTGTNTGYRVRINASNQLELAAGNNTTYITATTSDALTLGQRAVLTAWHDGTNLNVQINNGTVVQTAFATATAGTAQITIGKDNNAASSFFMGRLYEKVYLKDTVLSAASIASTKSFCAQKAKVTL